MGDVVNVLVDRHHHALFYSLQLLFEDRLGGTVYTPIGHEWWDEGIWRFGEVFGDDRLAQQYLNTAGWADNINHMTNRDGHHPERVMRGVTLEQARTMDWAYVVPSVQENQHGFKRFADEVGAKFVYQVGNHNQQVDWSLDPLALVSGEVPIRGRGLVYHQEIDTSVFTYREPHAEPTIRSFVNCFGSTSCAAFFVEAEGFLPEFTFGDHGIDGTDGNVGTITEIADLMAGSAFGWHDKVQGDGFGHVIHDWAAIGRPLIGHGSHYRGLMAEGFWQDMVTCIDLDKHTVTEAAGLIRDIVAAPSVHRDMCLAIRAEFDRIDYDAEAAAIKALLS